MLEADLTKISCKSETVLKGICLVKSGRAFLSAVKSGYVKEGLGLIQAELQHKNQLAEYEGSLSERLRTYKGLRPETEGGLRAAWLIKTIKKLEFCMKNSHYDEVLKIELERRKRELYEMGFPSFLEARAAHLAEEGSSEEARRLREWAASRSDALRRDEQKFNELEKLSDQLFLAKEKAANAEQEVEDMFAIIEVVNLRNFAFRLFARVFDKVMDSIEPLHSLSKKEHDQQATDQTLTAGQEEVGKPQFGRFRVERSGKWMRGRWAIMNEASRTRRKIIRILNDEGWDQAALALKQVKAEAETARDVYNTRSSLEFSERWKAPVEPQRVRLSESQIISQIENEIREFYPDFDIPYYLPLDGCLHELVLEIRSNICEERLGRVARRKKTYQEDRILIATNHRLFLLGGTDITRGVHEHHIPYDVIHSIKHRAFLSNSGTITLKKKSFGPEPGIIFDGLDKERSRELTKYVESCISNLA